MACAGLALVADGRALARCSQFDAALGQRQAVVTFRAGTPVSQRLAVRSACAKVPAVAAQPLPSNREFSVRAPAADLPDDTRPPDEDVARLETCLAKFPAVGGVTLQDSSDAR